MRIFALLLGLFAVTLQQLAPSCLKPTSVAHQLTIVLCTAAGLQTLVIDDSGSPGRPEEQDHDSTCTLCTHPPNTVAYTPPEIGRLEATSAIVYPRYINDARSSLLIFHFYASRAPPSLSA
jgi:hypothetical protein